MSTVTDPRAVQMGEPVEHRGITVAPLFPRLDPVAAYVSLDRGLVNGLVIDELNDHGEVSELRVVNRGSDAVLLWRDRHREIDCVITDLRMPEMGGRELIEQLRAERPPLPVVFMSGYSEQAMPNATTPHTAFVEKPFTMETLVGAVQRVLSAEVPA